MKKIVVLGSSGLLGHWLTDAFKRHQDLQIIKLGRSKSNDFVADLTDKKIVLESLSAITPVIILNLAAAANVDYCEQHPDQAQHANVSIPQNISEYLKQNPNCKSIHISTDHIYDGDGLKTEEQVTVRNVYASTKLEGEKFLVDPAGGTRSFVLRTNFFGRSTTTKDSFSDWVVKSFNSGKEFTLFNNSFFSPVHWSTIYEVILKCIDSEKYGIYNLGASGCMSKADFAIKVAKELNIYNENYHVSTSVYVAGRAKRPLNMCMNSSKISRALNVNIGTLENEIEKLKKEYL